MKKVLTTHQTQCLGFVKSPFKQKFGIPRQPRLVKDIVSTIVMEPEFSLLEAFKGIETFSHLWILFLFHENLASGWRPTIRPPRLGGKTKMGVFATRCTFRPNGIGQSAVKFRRIYQQSGRVYIEIEGADIMDGTPVIDIKPYITYSDSIPDATCGFAQEKPPAILPVNFSDNVLSTLKEIGKAYPSIKSLITQVLCTDPRPAYRQKEFDPNSYGIQLYEYNIKWKVEKGKVNVIEIQPLSDGIY